jgi:hypothetical protein
MALYVANLPFRGTRAGGSFSSSSRYHTVDDAVKVVDAASDLVSFLPVPALQHRGREEV